MGTGLLLVSTIVCGLLATTRALRSDSCWVAGSSLLRHKRIPVQIIRQLNEAQDLHDILRICLGGSSHNWRRIGNYGHLLWQIRSYQEDTLHLLGITNHLRGMNSRQSELKHESRRHNKAPLDLTERMLSDAPAERGKGSLRLEKRAACTPRPLPVRVPQPRDSEALHYPTCSDVDRCAGCCGHERLSCRPLSARNVTRQVFALRLASKSNAINFEGLKKVRLVEHTRCHCECKVRPRHCSTSQVYLEESCQCACPNGWMAANCTSPLTWDRRRCACVCTKRHLRCSTGFQFHTGLCRCVRDPHYDVYRRNLLLEN